MSSRFSWTGKGDGSSWDDKKNWSPEDVPKEADTAVIGPTTPDKRLPAVRLRGPVVVAGLELKGPRASIAGGAMTVRSEMLWEGGSVFTPLQVHGLLKVFGESDKVLRGQNGTVGITSYGSAVIDTTRLDFNEGATFTNLGTCRLVAPATLRWRAGGVPPEFVNEGTLVVIGPPLVIERPDDDAPPADARQAAPVAFGPVAAVVEGVPMVLRGTVEAVAASLVLASGHHELDGATVHGPERLAVGTGATLTLRRRCRLGDSARLVVDGGALRGGGKDVQGEGRVEWAAGDVYAPLTLGSRTTLDIPAGPARRTLRGAGAAAGADLTSTGEVVAGSGTVRLIEGAGLVSRGTFRVHGDVRLEAERPVVLRGQAVFRAGGATADRLTVRGALEVSGTVRVVGSPLDPVPAPPATVPLVLATADRLSGEPAGALPRGWKQLAVVADAGRGTVAVQDDARLRLIVDVSIAQKIPSDALKEIAARLAGLRGARVAADDPVIQVSSLAKVKEAVERRDGVRHLAFMAHGERGQMKFGTHQFDVKTIANRITWPPLDTVTIRTCNVAKKPVEMLAFAKAVKARVIAANRYWAAKPIPIPPGARVATVRAALAHHVHFLMPGTGTVEQLAGQRTQRFVVAAWFTTIGHDEVPEKPPWDDPAPEPRDASVTITTEDEAKAAAAYEEQPAGVDLRIYTFMP